MTRPAKGDIIRDLLAGRSAQYIAEKNGVTLRTVERWLALYGIRRPQRGPETRGPFPHGTVVGYGRHKCRCGECRAANAKAQREYRKACIAAGTWRWT